MTSSFTIPEASLKRLRAQKRAAKRAAKKFPGYTPATVTVAERDLDRTIRDVKAVEPPKAPRYYQRRSDDTDTDAIGDQIVQRSCVVDTATWKAGLVHEVASGRVRIIVPGEGLIYADRKHCFIIDEDHVLLSRDELEDLVAKIRFLKG